MQRLAMKFLRWGFPIALLVRRVYRELTRPIKIGVRALVVSDHQVLLVRHHGQAYWTLPGGLANRGESLRTAAIREVHEETGCVVQVERLLGIYSSLHEGMTLHTAVFVCRPITKPRAGLNVEIADARNWDKDVLPATRGDVADRLAEYAAGVQGIDHGL